MNTYKFSNKEVLWAIVCTLLGVLLSVGLQQPLVFGFLPGFIVLIGMVKRKGLPLTELISICLRGIHKTSPVIITLFLISFLLPAWYVSGTIEQLVDLALHFITPKYFILFSFLIAMVFSMLLGTSVGTLSSIGIPIIGSALAINLPVEIVAGALISGAFVGDRTSPLSSAHQLVAHTIELPVKKQFIAMIITTSIAIIMCILFYSALDYINEASLNEQQTTTSLWADISFIKFLPPLLLLGMVVFRIKIIYAFIFSVISASILSVMEGVSYSTVFTAYIFGVEDIGGGLQSMYLLLIFLGLAGAYNGVLEELKILQPYLDKWLQSNSSLVGDTFKTIIATLGISLISANQTLPIILTGRSFLPHWKEHHNKEELARVMGDSTMLFPAMVPWSVLAVMCSTILGVPLISYLPYAMFIWVLPLLTLMISNVRKHQRLHKSIQRVS